MSTKKVDLSTVWSEGDIMDIFPYGSSGDQEAAVLYNNCTYHIHLTEQGIPVSILGVVSDEDYDWSDSESIDVGEDQIQSHNSVMDWLSADDDVDDSSDWDDVDDWDDDDWEDVDWGSTFEGVLS